MRTLPANLPRLIGATGIALVFALGVAKADVIGAMPASSFATSPVSVSLGSGSFTFTGIPDTFPGNPPAEVSTGGSAMVTSFLGGVSDFSAGSTVDQTNELYGFSAFPMPTMIPNSAADDFIGLSFMNGTGLHYGYAEIAGTELVGYAYQSTPGASITTGATSTPVPEPSAAVLLLTGLIGLACVRRRRPNAANVSLPVRCG